MKKKYGMMILGAGLGLLLSACARSDSTSSSASSTQNGTGTTVQTETTSSGTAYIPAENSQSQADSSGTSAIPSSQTAPEEIPAQDGTTPFTEGTVESDDSIENAYTEETENTTEAAAADQGAEAWTGIYCSESEEILTIGVADAQTITFEFQNCEISGTASINGNEAVFTGDDLAQVAFIYSGDSVQVSVQSETGEELSDSPVNGIYVRE